MHLKYEDKLLPFLKYTTINVETRFLKKFSAIASQPKNKKQLKLSS